MTVENPRLAPRPAIRRRTSLFGDRTGATAVEYGLILALIAGVILAVIFKFGVRFDAARNNVGGAPEPNLSDRDGGGSDSRWLRTR